jgi:hypothetical protein
VVRIAHQAAGEALQGLVLPGGQGGEGLDVPGAGAAYQAPGLSAWPALAADRAGPLGSFDHAAACK